MKTLPKFNIPSSLHRGLAAEIVKISRKCIDHHQLVESLREAGLIYHMFRFKRISRGFCNHVPLPTGEILLAYSSPEKEEKPDYILNKGVGEILSHRGNQWLVAWNNAVECLFATSEDVHYVCILVLISRSN
ncbi:MAG: hypothetical protein AAB877_03165 [Patescibacteria group bacterium]